MHSRHFLVCVWCVLRSLTPLKKMNMEYSDDSAGIWLTFSLALQWEPNVYWQQETFRHFLLPATDSVIKIIKTKPHLAGIHLQSILSRFTPAEPLCQKTAVEQGLSVPYKPSPMPSCVKQLQCDVISSCTGQKNILKVNQEYYIWKRQMFFHHLRVCATLLRKAIA